MADTTVRYASYIEWCHARVLWGSDIWGVGGIGPSLSIVEAFNAALNQSPYADWTPIDVDTLFLGAGHTVSDFPCLFDMFGKFMAGLDIEILWEQVLEHTLNNPVVDAMTSAHGTFLQDEVDTTVLPRLMGGLRDINSVMSSVFVHSKAIVQDSVVKSMSKFRADLDFKLIDIAKQRWSDHLTWNKQVLAMYGEYAKLYLSAKMDTDTMKMDFQTKDKLWNLKLYEYVRAMLGAIQGMGTTPGLNEPSQTQKSISGAMSGAALGASIGSTMGGSGAGYGAAIGGVLGLAASFM